MTSKPIGLALPPALTAFAQALTLRPLIPSRALVLKLWRAGAACTRQDNGWSPPGDRWPQHRRKVKCRRPAVRGYLQMAEWSRPVFAGERPVYIRLPTFGFGPRRCQTAVMLNRSQRSSTCRALSFSARSLRSPLRSKMA